MAGTMRMEYKIGINSPLVRREAKTLMVEGDRCANTIVIEVTDGLEPANLNGCTASAYMICSDGKKPFVKGDVEGNVVTVCLNEGFYAVPGRYELFVRLTSTDGTKRTLLWLNGWINDEGQGDVIDTENVVPDLEDLLAQIDAMEKATESATTAAETANAAAQEAVEIATSKGNEALQNVADAVARQDVTLGQMADDILTKAPAIAESMEGMVCATGYASDMPLHGMKIFGKTTQEGTPTPDVPAELVSHGDGGNIVQTMTGKNLLPFPYSFGKEYASNGVTATVNDDGSVTLNGTATDTAYFYLTPWTPEYDLGIKGLEGKTVYVSGCPDGGGESIFRLSFSVYKNKEISHVTALYAPGTNALTLAAGEYIQSYIRVDAGKTVEDLVFKPMISLTNDADFVQTKTQILNLSTPNGLSGISVFSNGNYTDASGKQWVADYRDWGREVDVQRIGKIHLDGTQSIGALLVRENSVRVIYYGYANADPANNTLICNRLKQGNVYSNDVVGAVVASDNTSSCILGLPLSAGTTAEAVSAWIAAHPIDIQYIMETPIETPIPTNELAAYHSMHTNKPSTVVCNDAGAWQQVEYVADTKMYIDQKLAAIAAATLNN